MPHNPPPGELDIKRLKSTERRAYAHALTAQAIVVVVD